MLSQRCHGKARSQLQPRICINSCLRVTGVGDGASLHFFHVQSRKADPAARAGLWATNLWTIARGLIAPPEVSHNLQLSGHAHRAAFANFEKCTVPYIFLERMLLWLLMLHTPHDFWKSSSPRRPH